MIIRVAYIDHFCNIRYLVSMEDDDDSIQCPVCNGEGFDWMDLYVGSAKEMAKILISVHQKTSDTNINKFTL
jgi:hypothetical protein